MTANDANFSKWVVYLTQIARGQQPPPVLPPYALQVEFSTDQSPLEFTYPGEVGYLTGLDTAHLLSVSDGKLRHSDVHAVNNPMFFAGEGSTPTLFDRVPGRTLAIRAFELPPGTFSLAGWIAQAGGGSAIMVAPNEEAAVSENNHDLHGALQTPTTRGIAPYPYDVWIVLRESGAFVFLRDIVANGDPFLAWVSLDNTSTPLIAGYQAKSGSGERTIEAIRVDDLLSPFDSDFGIALVHTPPSASPLAVDPGAADFIADATLINNGTLGGFAGINFRASGDNYWQAFINGGGDLMLQRYVASFPTGDPVALGTGVVAAGGTALVRIKAVGDQLNFYTRVGGALPSGVWTEQGDAVTDSTLAANSGFAFAQIGDFYSLGEFTVYPVASDAYAILGTI